MTKSMRHSDAGWIDIFVLVGAGFFIFALVLSAVFDPRIRVLHFLQALIYVAVIVLTRRRSAWGFGAGFWIAAFWNYTNLFVSNFVRNGLSALSMWLHTGHLHKPDQLVAVVAAGSHFLLMAACVAGFVRLRPKVREWMQLIAGGALAVGYFAAIVYTTGPQYIPLVRRVFRLSR